MKKMDVKELTNEVFARYLGDAFEIKLNEGFVAFKLTEVSEFGSNTFNSTGRKPFLLQFQLDSSEVDWTLLTQRIFELQHEELGMMELFLTPAQADGNSSALEAVFN